MPGAVSRNQAGTRSVNLPQDNAGDLPGRQAAFSDQDDKNLVLVAAGGPKTESGNKIVEIKEKMFIARTNDIYLNPGDYMGKTIKLEGLFKREAYPGSDSPYCFVLRYGPGCCGNDGSAGFEVSWDREDGNPLEYPELDSWVEAVGVLKSYTEDDYPYLYLGLLSLTVKEQRGAEFVAQ
jgi:uncharacterized membrane protein YcgQ (UPF0703/DUF1980 family)